MTIKTSKDYAKDYTHPKLREKLKTEITNADKGGKAGEWSARKSQLLKQAYEAQGGGYKHSDHPTKAQKDLHQWSAEEWQTADQDKAIKDEKTKRYLPKKVWDNLSDSEKKQADNDKVHLSKSGQQYVNNTPAVKRELKAEHARKKNL